MTKRPGPELAEPLRTFLNGLPVPPGQRRVVEALIRDKTARTYPEIARALGVHIGTVHRHLQRLRARLPLLYTALMELRRQQLAERHRRALKRAQAHSRRWFRGKANRTHFTRYGFWPWQRKR